MLQDNAPRITIAQKHRQALLAETHALGHFGTNKMVDQIHAQSKTWPGLAKACLEYVK